MTEQEAIEIAKKVAETEGWGWIEPVSAHCRRRWFFGRRVWFIWSNAGSRGTIVRVKIDDATGKVLQKGYMPR